MTGTAVVVGSGPNGLTAAVLLARAGLDVTVIESRDTIGGGTRTESLTVPGLLHDVCSAVHPLGVASPALSTLDLARHGLQWDWPEIDLAHPLDGGRAGLLYRSMERTVDGLGADGPAWRRLYAPFADRFEELAADILRPVSPLTRHPILLARFGLAALAPASLVARRWHTDEARALFAGIAAHVFRPLTSPASASVAVMLGAAAHAHGWPVARGGSQAIADALAAELIELGGTVQTGRTITSLRELGAADVVMLDVAPGAAASLAGQAMPARTRRAYRRYRHGPAAFKLDLAVQEGVPWTNEGCRKAGTVHLGGTFEQIAAAERDVARGQMPERPFVLVAQQYLADPTRSVGDVHPVWAYAHVPHGWTGDASAAILDQFERFAPGTRERIVGQVSTSPGRLAEYNANYVGGDIAAGANDLRQLVLRPRPARNPYRTGIPGVFLCSAATPPGAGVHGMCGANAAASALRELRRD